MTSEESAIEAIVCRFTVHIAERDLVPDERLIASPSALLDFGDSEDTHDLVRRSEALQEILGADGSLDIDRLIAAGNRNKLTLKDIITTRITDELGAHWGLPSRSLPLKIVKEILAEDPPIVTDVRFLRGSVDIVGSVTLLVSNPLVKQIAKDVIIAVVAQSVERSVALAARIILRDMGIRVPELSGEAFAGDVEVDVNYGSSADVVVNPRTSQAPRKSDPRLLIHDRSLRTVARLSAGNLVISFVLLLAMLAYVFHVLP